MNLRYSKNLCTNPSNEPSTRLGRNVYSYLTDSSPPAYTLRFHSVVKKAMTRDFEGKVAVVTGGTSGIGRDTAVLFAKAGAKVVIAGRREAEGHETEELVRAEGGEGLFVKTDVSKAAEVEALIKNAVDKFGRLDVAFNNAGIEGAWAPIVRQSEEDWDRTIDINLKGVWLCLKYEIRQMLKQGGGGAIVNMSSIIGLIGSAGVAAYSASKHGVIGLTKTAALETATKWNSDQCSVPGRCTETAMADRIFRAPAVRKYVLSLPSHRPLWKADGNCRSRRVDVLRPRIFHDRPVSGS